jgi:hypothetical protein
MITRMSHGLFDCIGLPLCDGEAVYEFIARHQAELRGYPTPDGWFNAAWKDPSGAKVAVNINDRGGLEAVPGFAGDVTARITAIAPIDGTDAVAAHVVDEEGTEVTRLCADFDQRRFLPTLSRDETYEAIITALALEVRTYESVEAFGASPDADMGPLSQPQHLPDGTVMDRLRFGPESFLPAGMFQQPWNPMAVFSAKVEQSWTRNVEATGGAFRVARVITVGALGLYLCWPTEVAPPAAVGDTVYAKAYLTAMVPEVWRRQQQAVGVM